MDNRTVITSRIVAYRNSFDGSSLDSVLTGSDVSTRNRYVDAVLTNEDGSEKEIVDLILRKEIVINIMTNFRELQNNMTSSKKMAEVLHNRGLISTNRLNRIVDEYERDVTESNYLLLECVLGSGIKNLINSSRFQRIQCFLMQMKYTNQLDLIYLILSTGSKLNRPHTKWIGQSYELLTQNLTVDHSLLAYLLAEKVLDEYEMQDINSHPTGHMRISCLLKLIRMKSLHCNNIFLQALNKTEQQHLTQQLRKTQRSDCIDTGISRSFPELDSISFSNSQDQFDMDENYQHLLRKKSSAGRHSNQPQRRIFRGSNTSLFLLKDLALKEIVADENRFDVDGRNILKRNHSEPETLLTRTLREGAAKFTCMAVVQNLENSSMEVGKQLHILCRRGNRNAVIIPDAEEETEML